jgi:hypothetical protein
MIFKTKIKCDPELHWNSDLSNKTISRPPQSRETFPLRILWLHEDFSLNFLNLFNRKNNKLLKHAQIIKNTTFPFKVLFFFKQGWGISKSKSRALLINLENSLYSMNELNNILYFITKYSSHVVQILWK